MENAKKEPPSRPEPEPETKTEQKTMMQRGTDVDHLIKKTGLERYRCEAALEEAGGDVDRAQSALMFTQQALCQPAAPPPEAVDGRRPCREAQACYYVRYPDSPGAQSHRQEFYHPGVDEEPAKKPLGCPDWANPCAEGAKCVWITASSASTTRTDHMGSFWHPGCTTIYAGCPEGMTPCSADCHLLKIPPPPGYDRYAPDRKTHLDTFWHPPPAGCPEGMVACGNGAECGWLKPDHVGVLADSHAHKRAEHTAKFWHEPPPGCPEGMIACGYGAKCNCMTKPFSEQFREHMQVFWHPRPDGCPEDVTPCGDRERCQWLRAPSGSDYRSDERNKHIRDFWHPRPKDAQMI